MFLIDGPTPPDAPTLSRALADSIHRHFEGTHGQTVRVEDKAFPNVALLSVDFTSARVHPDRRPPSPAAVVSRKSGIIADRLLIAAHPLEIEDVGAIDLRLEAEDVDLQLWTDAEQRHWLVPHRSRHGHADLRLSPEDVRGLFLHGAEMAAEEHGVIIHESDLQLTPAGESSVNVFAHVVAHKMFLRASLRFQGRMRIDDQLQAHFSSLSCAGDGTLGQIASSFIQPHLAKLESQSFPLLALQIGDIRLRHAEVNVDAHGALHVSARFGE